MKDRYPHGFWLGLLGVICAGLVDVACPRPAVAQEINAVYSVGKTINIAAGTWTTAQMPGIEVTRGPFAAYTTLYFDRSGLFEKDFGASFTREHKRVTFTLGGDIYKYSVGGFDWLWSTSVKVRIR